ncbi:MAG: hypothetical protein IH586_17860 [Anaerolineaceae bacterium]|nr:hypothetical protein [Anaerolineaceae bacterium]
MHSKTIVGKILSILIIAAIFAGCNVAPTATPTSVATVDQKPTFDAISTQAVQTMVANLTLNAPPATQTSLPTDTPVPTATNPPLPTNTPAPTETPTRVFIPWTKTPTATEAVYNCTVTGVTPTTSTTIKVDQDFDAKWTVKNSGVKTWSSGNTDIRYVDGTKMHSGGDVRDLNSDVAPNGTYTVTIDMKAPGSDGTYSTSWGIYLEDGTVCTLSLKINVSN